MIGTKDKEILWTDVMTWSEVDTLPINIRDVVNLEMANGVNNYSGKLTDEDMFKFVKWLGQEVQESYVKPDFKQYDYIEVAPSTGAVLASYLVVLLINIGIAVFVIKNAWEDAPIYNKSVHTRKRSRRPSGLAEKRSRKKSKKSGSKYYRYR